MNRKPQCDHHNGISRCISVKHSWFTIHHSWGRGDFGWYSWDRTKRKLTTKQMIKVRDRG